jgi:hypothetical protein
VQCLPTRGCGPLATAGFAADRGGNHARSPSGRRHSGGCGRADGETYLPMLPQMMGWK